MLKLLHLQLMLTWKKVVKSAKLYLNDTVVATATNSDVSDATGSTITFENINNLDFPTVESELRLAIVTETIGYEKVGETVLDVAVTAVAMTDAEGVDSSETVIVDVTDVDTAPETDSELFSVVPAVVVASVDQKLETGSVKVTDAVAVQPAVISSVTVTVNIPPARPLITCVVAALSHK